VLPLSSWAQIICLAVAAVHRRATQTADQCGPRGATAPQWTRYISAGRCGCARPDRLSVLGRARSSVVAAVWTPTRNTAIKTSDVPLPMPFSSEQTSDLYAAPGRQTVTEFFSYRETYDVRFPTSRHLDGSDAMNPLPDYSAAYLVLRTSAGREDFGLTFTAGRGNDVQVAAIRALAPLVVGQPVGAALADMASSRSSPPRSSAGSASTVAEDRCSAPLPVSCCCS
jgi:hypothetical protein